MYHQTCGFCTQPIQQLRVKTFPLETTMTNPFSEDTREKKYSQRSVPKLWKSMGHTSHDSCYIGGVSYPGPLAISPVTVQQLAWIEFHPPNWHVPKPLPTIQQFTPQCNAWNICNRYICYLFFSLFQTSTSRRHKDRQRVHSREYRKPYSLDVISPDYNHPKPDDGV